MMVNFVIAVVGVTAAEGWSGAWYPVAVQKYFQNWLRQYA